MLNPADCLPPELRHATITRVGAGLSDAAVYRVEAADGRAYALKTGVNLEKLPILQLAADARLAPRVVHVDQERGAILSEFVSGGFLEFYGNPATREEAVRQLGQTLRRIHELPQPPEAKAYDPLQHLANVSCAEIPAFAAAAVARVRSEPEPPQEQLVVLSHNDVNPTNIVYDGKNLSLVDWEHAAPNDPLFDLASIAVFLCLDDETCLRLLSAYEGRPVTLLTPRFRWNQRRVAIVCGASGAPGWGPEARHIPLDAVPALPEFFARLRSGELSLATAEGRRAFGMALVKTGLSY